MTSSDDATPGVLYTRLSAVKARDKKAGREDINVAEQEARLRRLAGVLSITVGDRDVFTDNDLTAYKGSRRYKGRPGFDKMLRRLAGGGVKVILVYQAFRLYRSHSDLEKLMGLCKEHGISIKTIQGGDLDLTSATGQMVAEFLASVAKQEVALMIERARDGKQRLREAGDWPGGRRGFGYAKDPDAPGGVRPVPEEAAAIRDGYAWLLDGISLNAIGGRWNARGLRTPVMPHSGDGGQMWDGPKVGAVLRRASNAGLVELQPRDEKNRRAGPPVIVGPGNWEHIVDEDTWKAAKAILADPSRRIPGSGRPPAWLLTGNNGLVCGKCGGTVFRVQHPKGRFASYVCATRSFRPETERVSLNGCVGRNQQQLDAFAERLVIEKLRKSGIARLAGPAVDVAALDARRTALNASLAEWAAQPGVTPRQVAIASAPILAELGKVEDAISGALRGSPLEKFADGKDPEDVWDNDLTLEEQRAIVREMLRIEILPVKGRGKGNGPKMPAGWHPGDPYPFDETSVRVTTPDGRPWGTAGQQDV